MSRTGDVVRTGLRGVGQTLITLGLVMLLFCFYELKVTNLVTEREQGRLTEELTARWAEPVARDSTEPVPAAPGTPVEPGGPVAAPVAQQLGSGFAVLRIPRLGDWNDEPPVVVEGVGVEDLKKGPGHIPDTALPGEIGNVVLSGHRTTYGAPFNRFDELQPGDAVVLETRDMWFTYEVTDSQIVAPTAVEVTFPVPGDADATPTKRLLTMTTCNPEYSARERLIISAEMVRAEPKGGAAPVALQGL
ncbi:MAG: class E sortase [Actinobacteria bacterium]|nr:class E sortase [Actinomycetota bacterium]MBW3647043.1 class E sortase [Actinomycetota bacterium]